MSKFLKEWLKLILQVVLFLICIIGFCYLVGYVANLNKIYGIGVVCIAVIAFLGFIAYDTTKNA